MDTLTSLARTNSEKADMARPMTEGPDVAQMPDYPSGLMLYVDNETLRKLGYNNGALEAGDTCGGLWKGIITNAAANRVNGVIQYSATIQMTDMSLSPTSDADARADTLYPSAKAGE